jgi:hypothetical protein
MLSHLRSRIGKGRDGRMANLSTLNAHWRPRSTRKIFLQKGRYSCLGQNIELRMRCYFDYISCYFTWLYGFSDIFWLLPIGYISIQLYLYNIHTCTYPYYYCNVLESWHKRKRLQRRGSWQRRIHAAFRPIVGTIIGMLHYTNHNRLRQRNFEIHGQVNYHTYCLFDDSFLLGLAF